MFYRKLTVITILLNWAIIILLSIVNFGLKTMKVELFWVILIKY